VFAGDWALMDSGSWNGPLNGEGTRPSHLIGWSKLQLGFINDSEHVDVTLNNETTATIVPTSSQDLPPGNFRLAIVNISDGVYYTVEVRDRNSSVFEQYLPDSGVLVSYCNDSARDDIFYGEPGAAVVMNAQPSYPSKEHATFDLGAGENSKFIDQDRNIIIEVLQKNQTNGAYTVHISYLDIKLEWIYINGSDVWQLKTNSTHEIAISLRNVGSSVLNNVQATLIADSANVTVVNSTVAYGNLQAGQSLNGSDEFTVDVGGIVGGTPINFTLNITYDGLSQPTAIPFQIPVQLESTPPDLDFIKPSSDEFNASEPIQVLCNVSDDMNSSYGGIFKAWLKILSNETNSLSTGWSELVFNGTHVSGEFTLNSLGNYTVLVRLMDNSGNVIEKGKSMQIIDEVPPIVLLTVQKRNGDSARFAVLGSQLVIVAVVIDNNEVEDVELSINAGQYFSIVNQTTSVEVTGGGNAGIARGVYTGYYHEWSPSVEGNQLVVVRGADPSGNFALASWELTVLSETSIGIIILGGIIVLVAIISLVVYANKKRALKKSKGDPDVIVIH
ncbi:MAG: hypothetical protein ACTSXP_09910, partial [Promethearchaeota archaeon]